MVSDKYWDHHDSNPINDKEETNWCKNCQSFLIKEDELCHVCINENYSECCGTELTGEYMDIRICPQCKEHI